MADYSQQIEEIEEELRKTPHHKGTDHFFAKMRAKIARLKDRQYESVVKSKGGGGGGGYGVKKQGDATVVLVGPPSAGKSTLLNDLTNADSKVAAYDFTTLNVVPGMMVYREAYIQIFDIPGLIEGAQRGKGRGKEVISIARGADLLLVMTDVERIHLLDMIKKELYQAGIRINQEKPNINIIKTLEGGVEIKSNIKQDIDNESIKLVAKEFGIKNAEITFRERVTLDELIDSFSPNRAYIKALFVVNKVDLNKKFSKDKLPLDTVYISAEERIGIDNLVETIWKKLNLITVYLIKDDEKLHFNSPIIMRENEKLLNILPKLGSTFEEKYKMAKIWGKSAKFPGQEVPLTANLSDGLQVRFI
ncbi:50S ribosome-binding GTPase [Patescibacteria group bacterium]|nr:50S ribosome-binding GTPase [Patescibacteria group bacterium]MBU2035838.1 50S ribosome-binding GTPase [Patescibacteria group bacterium]